MSDLKLGIIGLGGIAQKHLEAFGKLKRVRISALCTASADNLARHSQKWGIGGCYTDYHEMLADADIDAVVACVPPYLHKAVCMAALDAGKHVLCEKPPAMNAGEALEMQTAADGKNLLLMYGFMFRFSQKHRIAREICLGGELGQLYFVRSETMRRCSVPRGWFEQKSLSGGGPVMDFGVHSLDLVMYLMGEASPVRVYSKAFKNIENMDDVRCWTGNAFGRDTKAANDVEEMAAALISFDNGAELLFSVSNAAHIKQDYKAVEMLGTKGGLTVDPQLEIHTVSNRYVFDSKPVVNCDRFDYQGSIDSQAEHFVSCICDGIPCISPAGNGVRVMKTVDAIYRSAQTGEAVLI